MIALLGGSFDPIHLGHCQLAKEICARYAFSTLYFVPANQNPHKSLSFASAGERLEMVARSVNEMGEPRFQVLRWEAISDAPSFTIHTVERLLQSETPKVVLIMGNEVFENLPQWHEAKRLCTLACIIVVTRQSHLHPRPSEVLRKIGLANIVEMETRTLHSGGELWVDLLSIPTLPYCATELRKEIAKKWQTDDMEHPPRGIQRSVWRFIKENRIYAESQ